MCKRHVRTHVATARWWQCFRSITAHTVSHVYSQQYDSVLRIDIHKTCLTLWDALHKIVYIASFVHFCRLVARKERCIDVWMNWYSCAINVSSFNLTLQCMVAYDHFAEGTTMFDELFDLPLSVSNGKNIIFLSLNEHNLKWICAVFLDSDLILLMRKWNVYDFRTDI